MTAIRRVDIGGLELVVIEDGHGEAVVFHPGLGYAAWSFRRLTPFVAAHYRTLKR